MRVVATFWLLPNTEFNCILLGNGIETPSPIRRDVHSFTLSYMEVFVVYSNAVSFWHFKFCRLLWSNKGWICTWLRILIRNIILGFSVLAYITRHILQHSGESISISPSCLKWTLHGLLGAGFLLFVVVVIVVFCFLIATQGYFTAELHPEPFLIFFHIETSFQ